MRHLESSTTSVRLAPLTRPRGASSRGRACWRGDSATNHSTVWRRTSDTCGDAPTTRRSWRTRRTDGAAAASIRQSL